MIFVRLSGSPLHINHFDLLFQKIGVFGRTFSSFDDDKIVFFYCKLGDFFLDRYAFLNLDTGEIFSSVYSLDENNQFNSKGLL